MKIAIILPSLANTGPVLVANNLVFNLLDRVDGVDVFYFDEITEISFPCPTKRIKFSERIDFNIYDVVFSSLLRPDLYVYVHKAKNARAKCISTMHNYMRDDLYYQYGSCVAMVFSRIWQRILSRHDLIVTLSEDMKEYYKKKLKHKEIAVIPNGIDPTEDGIIDEEDIEPIARLKDRYKIIGTNAVITRRKGIDQLLSALERLPEYALVIVGAGREEPTLRTMSNEAGLANRVLFLGYRKMASRYNSVYDVYAMPSRSEGFGLAMIEAAHHRIPIVCSNIKTFREIFSEDEASFFELENIDSFRRAIIRASENSDSLAKNAYAKVTREYSSAVMADRYYNAFAHCIGADLGVEG
jgi:L-malate glycosyltransferase